MYLHNYLLSSNINLYLLNVTIVCQINQCTNPRYLPWADVVTNNRISVNIGRQISSGGFLRWRLVFKASRWNDDFSVGRVGTNTSPWKIETAFICYWRRYATADASNTAVCSWLWKLYEEARRGPASWVPYPCSGVRYPYPRKRGESYTVQYS